MASFKEQWGKLSSGQRAILIIVGILLIGGIVGSSQSDDKPSAPEKSNETNQNQSQKSYKFTDRADKQETDVEVLLNEPATVKGVKMTVTKAEYKDSISEFEEADSGKKYLVIDVNMENVSNETKRYSSSDFRIQTVGGQVLDNTFGTIDTLDSADLVAGGKVSGKVLFEVPIEDGQQYVIWKPSFDPDRAIVQVK